MYIYLFDPLGVLFGPVSLPEVPGLGYQMPGNGVEMADLLATPDSGNVWVLVNAVPVQLPDHRGPVFRVDTGEELEWEKLGELPEGYTLKPYPGEYHVWLNGSWVLDAPAETAGLAKLAGLQRDTLMNQATTAIAPLQDAVDLGLETPEKVALLQLWKRYRIDLSDVEQQVGFPVSIDWPTTPSV